MKLIMDNERVVLYPSINEWVEIFKNIFGEIVSNIKRIDCMKTKEIGSVREEGKLKVFTGPDD